MAKKHKKNTDLKSGIKVSIMTWSGNCDLLNL